MNTDHYVTHLCFCNTHINTQKWACHIRCDPPAILFRFLQWHTGHIIHTICSTTHMYVIMEVIFHSIKYSSVYIKLFILSTWTPRCRQEPTHKHTVCAFRPEKFGNKILRVKSVLKRSFPRSHSHRQKKLFGDESRPVLLLQTSKNKVQPLFWL